MISGFNHVDLGVVNFNRASSAGNMTVFIAQYPDLDSELFTNKKPSVITIDARVPDIGSIKVSLLCSYVHDELSGDAMIGTIAGIISGNKFTSEIVIQKKSATLFLNTISLG